MFLMRYERKNVFVLVRFMTPFNYCDDLFYCSDLNNNRISHVQSLTAYFLVLLRMTFDVERSNMDPT